MKPPPRKKLIEVALPLDAINRESAREKSIRHGHPSTLHLWWARRPLAACRAVLFSSLVDDPSSDPHLRKPDGSRDEELEGERRGHLFNLIEELVRWENSNNDTIINAARAEIARSVASRRLELGELRKDQLLPGGIKPWDLIVRGQVRTHASFDKEGKAHIIVTRTDLPPDAVNAFLAEHAPPVLDPFCGGGSIPLEAQRLGLRAYASDLNPVAVLITKALIEIPPKFAGRPPVNREWQKKSREEKAAKVWHGAQGLAEDVRYYGKWMRDEAEKRIGHLYPKVKVTRQMVGEREGIKCLISTTVTMTEHLACGHPDLEPYVGKQVRVTEDMAYDRPDLKDHVGQELTVIAWLWARTIRCPNPACQARTPLVRSFYLSKKAGKEAYSHPVLDRARKMVRFEVRLKGEPLKHTTDAKGARCLFCDRFVRKPELRDIACAHGVDAIPLAVVCEGERGRVYLPTTDCSAFDAPRPDVAFLDRPMTNDKRWFSPPLYGLPNFADLFTSRQLIALTTFSDLVTEAREGVLADARAAELTADPAASYADAVATYLAFAVDKGANYWSSLTGWHSGRDIIMSTFGRQALPMVWDYAEANPLSDSSGNIVSGVDQAAQSLERWFGSTTSRVRQRDAMQELRDLAPIAISTDPPYYDNIGYSDLSDFFYVWLRRSVATVYPDLFRTVLTPKAEELIATPYRHDGSKDAAMEFFETGLGRAFERMKEASADDYPLTVFYAFKQSESDEEDDNGDSSNSETASTGWETMLEGLIQAGMSINGTWPMRTELIGNLKKQVNALATSVVLVCRRRAADAAMTTRKDFVAALKKELPAALRDLQSGNIAPVDLAQAAIGPGMAIYSRYSKVVNSDGSRMPVRTALQLINQALDEVLSELESEFDSETRWAIKWFEQHAHDEGAFGDAETLSKAMAVSVHGLREAGLVKDGQGKVRLLRRDELAADWDPATDKRLTIWEVTQYLIRRLESGGDAAAAELLRKVGSLGEVARDLAYRLYSTCERKKWAEEARSYNGLVVAWGEIGRMSRVESTTVHQEVLF